MQFVNALVIFEIVDLPFSVMQNLIKSDKTRSISYVSYYLTQYKLSSSGAFVHLFL